MNADLELLHKRAQLLSDRIASTDDVFLRENLAGDLAHVNATIAAVTSSVA